MVKLYLRYLEVKFVGYLMLKIPTLILKFIEAVLCSVL